MHGTLDRSATEFIVPTQPDTSTVVSTKGVPIHLGPRGGLHVTRPHFLCAYLQHLESVCYCSSIAKPPYWQDSLDELSACDYFAEVSLAVATVLSPRLRGMHRAGHGLW